MTSAGTVALTGATGFIGSVLARTLTRNNWQVRALVRPQSLGTALPGGVSPISGSLEDPASLGELISGADVIIHCAGVVRGATTNYFDRTNVDGVKRLAELAAQLSPPPRFLLMSSLAASLPEISAYAASKNAGERALAASAGTMHWTAFRPCAVYGPGDREMLPLFRVMEKGFAPVWSDDSTRFSLLYVQDLAAAVMSWLSANTPNNSIFELHDGRPDGYSIAEVIATAEVALGRRIRRLPVPRSGLSTIANINIRLAKILGYAPMLTPWKVRELRHPRWVCDNADLSAATGWHPQVVLKDALLPTLRGESI